MITSADEFIRLRDSNIPVEYHRAASEEASMEVWQSIITKYPTYKKWVVQNKTVPIEILMKLVRDIDPDVRWAVANKRKLSIELQSILVQDIDENVRVRLLYNKKVDDGIIQILRNDKSSLVQKVIIEKFA